MSAVVETVAGSSLWRDARRPARVEDRVANLAASGGVALLAQTARSRIKTVFKIRLRRILILLRCGPAR